MSDVLKAAAIALCLTAVFSPRLAQADAADSAKAQAQATLREGNALMGQGRATDALMKFTEAYRLFPSPKLHYNLGQAHSLIAGHEAQAYESMSRFLTEATDANPELRTAAETQRQQLRPKVGLVSVTAEPADAELVIDDVNVGAVARDVPRVVGIGAHRISLKKDSTASTPETVTIAGGEALQVRLSLAPTAIAAPAPALPAAPEPALTPVTNAVASPPANLLKVGPESQYAGYWTWQRKVGAGLGGVAVAALAVGIVEHVRYFGKHDDFVKAGCVDDSTLAMHPNCQGLKNQFNSAHVGWVVSYVAASVLVGTGAYFLWLSPDESAQATSMTSGVTANMQGRF